MLVHRLGPQVLPFDGSADLVGAGEAGKGIPPQDVAGGVGHQGDGVHPMLGGDGGAVVESGPFIQVEQDGIPVVGALPAGGRPGRAGAVGLDVSQAVIELVVDDPGIVAAGNAVVGHQGVPGIGDAVVEVDPFGLSAGLGPCVGLALLLGLVPTGNQSQGHGENQSQRQQTEHMVSFQSVSSSSLCKLSYSS